MTAMVQTDLVPPPGHKYKDDPADDPLRQIGGGHHARHPHSLQQHPRPAALVQQHKQQPNSPHQPSTSMSPAYSTLNNIPLQNHPSYGQPAQEHPAYYASHPNPYPAASTPSQYPSSGPPDLMAATAQMQRPYPPIYHTPQSNSPVSVASPQTHDQHGRSLYAQSPQMAPQMYAYPPYSSMNPVHPAYAPHPPPPQHPLSTHPLMMPPQTNSAPIQHPQTQPHPTTMNSSPRQKVEPIQPQRTPMQRSPMTAPGHATPTAAVTPIASNNVPASQPPGTNPNAAPGPIPATTPLVVRQDTNGVQWIAFEYSRDRVKMQYTIRCDVESVNVEDLAPDFKTENCVYPRAYCSKEQYRGNRLVYETECNAVGWALAELNPPLRGKRGLIQRAVDSWRNSNQDPRLRSRRVRRMAKINRRQSVQPAQPNLTVPTPSLPPTLPGRAATLSGPGGRPGGSLSLGPPIHHHHAHSENSTGNEEVSGGTDYANGAHRSSLVATGPVHPMHGTPDLRTGQVFHGLSTYPSAATAAGVSGGPSMPPSLHAGGFDAVGRHSVATAARRADVDEFEAETEARDPDNAVLFGSLPEGKRRKFILVDDPQRGCRVRVKVMLDQVDMDEIPDSYRLSNAVYPRAYFPVQMKSPPGRVIPGKRFFEDENEDEDDGSVTVGRTLVPALSTDGEADTAVPRLSRGRNRKEMVLNDLGYRMSWSQSRVFAGRTMFLQRSLDAYRNKMRSTMLTAGQEPSSIASHFETRSGKRRWLERGRQSNANSGYAAVTTSASRRSAEEVEG